MILSVVISNLISNLHTSNYSCADLFSSSVKEMVFLATWSGITS